MSWVAAALFLALGAVSLWLVLDALVHACRSDDRGDG